MKMVDVINEGNNTVVGQVPKFDGPEIAKMVDTAFAVQSDWEKVPLFERGAVLYKFCALVDQHRDEIATAMANEMGKPIMQARAETTYAAEIGRNNIEVGKHLYGRVLCDSSEGYENHVVTVTHEALGVVVGIIPFNYPVELTIQKMVPALLMGNSMIIKADPNAAINVKILIDLAHEAGVPKDVLHYITADIDVCTEYLLTNKKVACIALTGGGKAGTAIMNDAAPDIKKVILELGGNDPLIITEECAEDPELMVKAIECLGWGRIVENNGQVCASPKRTIVHRKAHDIFVQCLLKFVSGLKRGDATDPTAELTRLVTVKAAERVESQIQHTVDQGAKIIYGGHRDGCKFDVTILDNVTKDMDIAKDMEVFGPIVPIITYDTDEEAVAIANQSSYGLSSSVITKDLKKAHYFGEAIESSAVWVNGSSALRHNDQPFGGCKSTGIGVEGAGYSCAEFSRLKTVGYCDVSPKKRLFEHKDGMGDFLAFDRYTAEVKKVATALIKK
ncbi:MAG: aldehyde dehydrogenase family protein [Megasphaera sp.]|jgi:acyl-CoA reductase-like NAD-dependent aldehyde dehydrogenase|nr:aldehyde dehydrogenase family protein [Megasphaera sp.]MCH4188184.1 aldehyde dehydrogenase family protein [Megasphaera sp.]MCH4217914.1 aldehyde dehydrogenase family protein [Megasphaera sp.]